ncbi:hypothetical protein BX591_12259 [Paraburkholderia bryophila]|uniref:Uncharacterized protein n=1 Tax=Paraburkholderia bryophila TaxID=420952 RepID=A0A329BUN2_9BURK|nr:hypothetical protein BX591_12259 [Paraburkholderia bryophila]
MSTHHDTRLPHSARRAFAYDRCSTFDGDACDNWLPQRIDKEGNGHRTQSLYLLRFHFSTRKLY